MMRFLPLARVKQLLLPIKAELQEVKANQANVTKELAELKALLVAVLDRS